MPFLASFIEVTFVASITLSNVCSTRFARIFTRSRSAPGSSPGIISTTDTFVPSAAYTDPSSSPMYPPPTTSIVFGISGRSSAPLESSTRGLSSDSDGIVVGWEPVASTIASTSTGCSPPEASATVKLDGPVSAARPCR
jgi:hypothetical protein